VTAPSPCRIHREPSGAFEMSNAGNGEASGGADTGSPASLLSLEEPRSLLGELPLAKVDHGARQLVGQPRPNDEQTDSIEATSLLDPIPRHR
jgi:hypothetical protein